MNETQFLNKVLAIFPNAMIAENDSGETIIETGLRFDGDEYINIEGGQ